jgi:hypothetical protein
MYGGGGIDISGGSAGSTGPSPPEDVDVSDDRGGAGMSGGSGGNDKKLELTPTDMDEPSGAYVDGIMDVIGAANVAAAAVAA